MDPRPGEADVQQPPFLVEQRIVVEGLADRERAVLEHRQRDGIPLEALGAVVREQVHAVGRARALPRASTVQLREIPGRIEAAVGPELRREDVDERVERGGPLTGLVAGATLGGPRRPGALTLASYPSFEAHRARIAPLRAGPVAVSVPAVTARRTRSIAPRTSWRS